MQANLPETVNSVCYNCDCSCLALATNRGFKIFVLQPQVKLKQERDFGAPIQLIEMIERSNLIGLVGYEDTPFSPGNKLAIFDDRTQRIIADMSFRASIKGLRIRQKKILVALYNKVYILDLFAMEVEHILQTFNYQEAERYNLIAMSNSPINLILAAPAKQNGCVMLIFYSRLTERIIKAHQSTLSAVQLSQTGDKLVTTSEKGIQIRVFETKSGEMLHELRRGNQYANVYSLVFSKNGNWLAISSDSENIHIFAVKSIQEEKERSYGRDAEGVRNNPKPLLYFMKGLLPYFDTEYSYCSYKVPNFQTDMRNYLGFGHDDILMVTDNYGHMLELQLSLKGGRCNRKNEGYRLMEMKLL